MWQRNETTLWLKYPTSRKTNQSRDLGQALRKDVLMVRDIWKQNVKVEVYLM